ncbi:MAG: prepilin-type N-terminal cleavage/methylation domain-containing protein [Verrucomicrobiota bacterium]
MKNFHSTRTDSGFSMIELMTVIGIMVLLAGILIASLPGIQVRIDRSNVETFIAELEAGLSTYQIENGIYPQNPPSGDRDSSGVEGSRVLYKYLSGDWDENGEVDPDETVYVPRLTLRENDNAKKPRVSDIGGFPRVVDAFSNPIRYIAEPPNLPSTQRNSEMRNPTYDLWAIADADPEDPEDEPKYITNWGN